MKSIVALILLCAFFYFLARYLGALRQLVACIEEEEGTKDRDEGKFLESNLLGVMSNPGFMSSILSGSYEKHGYSLARMNRFAAVRKYALLQMATIMSLIVIAVLIPNPS